MKIDMETIVDKVKSTFNEQITKLQAEKQQALNQNQNQTTVKELEARC